MTVSTSLLIWLYSVVNGKEIKEIKEFGNGSITKNTRSGNVKGE